MYLMCTDLYTLKWLILHYVCFYHNSQKWFNASFIVHGVKYGFLALVYKNLPNLSSPPTFSLLHSHSFCLTSHFSHHTRPGAHPKHWLFSLRAMRASPCCVCPPAASPAQSPRLHLLCLEKSHLLSGLNTSTASFEGYQWAPHLSLGKLSLVDTLTHRAGMIVTVLVTVYYAFIQGKNICWFKIQALGSLGHSSTRKSTHCVSMDKLLHPLCLSCLICKNSNSRCED